MKKNQTFMLIGVVVLIAVIIYYMDDIKKFFESLSTGGGSGGSGGSDFNINISDARSKEGSNNPSPVTPPPLVASPASLSVPSGFVSLVAPPSFVGGSTRTLVSTDSGLKGFADIPTANKNYTALVKSPSTGKIVGALDVSTNTYVSNAQIKQIQSLAPNKLASFLQLPSRLINLKK